MQNRTHVQIDTILDSSLYFVNWPGGCGAGGARLMIFLQLGLGQAILWLVVLQMSKQLQGHRTYLRPVVS